MGGGPDFPTTVTLALTRHIFFELSKKNVTTNFPTGTNQFKTFASPPPIRSKLNVLQENLSSSRFTLAYTLSAKLYFNIPHRGLRFRKRKHNQKKSKTKQKKDDVGALLDFMYRLPLSVRQTFYKQTPSSLKEEKNRNNQHFRCVKFFHAFSVSNSYFQISNHYYTSKNCLPSYLHSVSHDSLVRYWKLYIKYKKI